MESSKVNSLSVQNLNQPKEPKKDVPPISAVKTINSNSLVTEQPITKINNVENKSSSNKELKNPDEAGKQTTSVLIQKGLMSGRPVRDKLAYNGEYEPTHSEIRNAVEREGGEDFPEESWWSRILGCFPMFASKEVEFEEYPESIVVSHQNSNK